MKGLFWFSYFLVISMLFPAQSFSVPNASAQTEAPEDEILSWYFHGLTGKNLKIFGNPTIQRGLVGNALSFDGNDYLTIKSMENGTIPAVLTLSAWVKPDYSQSSSVSTILYSKNSFELIIENYNSKHIAQFSIFDGSKWVSVRSNSEIPQEWTNIVATYDKNQLSILINGNLDSEKSLYDTAKYYAYGHPVEKITGITTGPILQGDVFVGATKSKSSLGKFFGGQIDEIQYYLTPGMVIQGRPEIKLDNTYTMNITDCSSDATVTCSIELTVHTESENNDKVTVTFEKGNISFRGVDYSIRAKDWRGTIPLKIGQATFSGWADSEDGQQIYVTIVGILSDNTRSGPIFRTSGSIKTTDEIFGMTGSAEMQSMVPLWIEKPKVVEEKVVVPKIVLLTKHFTSTFAGNYFRFDSKVYYEDKNPLGDFYQLGGEVKDATITAKLISSTNTILHTFEGNTDESGHFKGEYIIPKNIQPGTYFFTVTAVKGESVSTNELVTFMTEEPRTKTTVNTGPQITLIGAN